MSRLAALIVVLVLAVAPAAAIADVASPFAPLETAPTQTTTTIPPAPPPTSSGGGGLGDRGAALLGIAGAVVVVGIGLFIARDARRSAPKKRARVHSAIANPDAEARSTPGSRGRVSRPSAKRRKPSPAERKRRKRARGR